MEMVLPHHESTAEARENFEPVTGVFGLWAPYFVAPIIPWRRLRL